MKILSLWAVLAVTSAAVASDWRESGAMAALPHVPLSSNVANRQEKTLPIFCLEARQCRENLRKVNNWIDFCQQLDIACVRTKENIVHPPWVG